MKYTVAITDAFYYLIEVDADDEEEAYLRAIQSEQYNKKKFNETYNKVEINEANELIS